MGSIIVSKLKPKLNTLVLIKCNIKPEGATQAKKDIYFCIMSFFAQSVTKGKIIVFDNETYGCPGACAGLGFGTAYDKAMGGFETFSSFFAKGLQDADNKDDYSAFANKKPKHVKDKLIEGERFHCSKAKAYKWISEDLPLFNYPEKYRILKPLSELLDNEVPDSVIFTVNPLELTALITLTGSITEGVNSTITPQGAACQMIGNFVFDQSAEENPKAVLGLIDLAARHTVKNSLPSDVLTFSVPWKLFLALEKEAIDGIFESPLWKNMQ